MNNRPTRLVIVGGGSAGWITAAVLNSKLRAAGQPVSITLIESARIGRIGVGEATIPSMRDTLRIIGVTESEFLACCDATFKQGILFKDWKSKGSEYFHPFNFRTLGEAGKQAAINSWLGSDQTAPYIDLISEQPALAMQGYGPKTPNDKDFQGPLSYAYHIDAEKFAVLLASRAEGWGISHVIDDVTLVERADNGDIAAVACASGSRIEGDLFIDCTGFARRLIKDEMGATFESYSDWLMCDSAVAMRIPTDNPDLPPYTTSTALDAGWLWQIQLQNRMGSGYVYSSAHLSPEAAEAEMRVVLGVSEDVPARHIAFDSGHVDQPWIGNCVAIGLSAGFLEPLESTGLYFIEEGAKMLAALFPESPQMDRLARLYNQRLIQQYEECLDFINLHYRLTQRRDTAFWRDAVTDERTTPALAEMLARWAQKPPTTIDFNTGRRLFGRENWTAILYGMGAGTSDDPSKVAELAQTPAIRASGRRLSMTLPKHDALVRALSERESAK